MAWWIGIAKYRQRAAIIAVVAFAHLIGLAAILSHVVEITDPPARTVLELELVELTPAPTPPPEPRPPAPDPIPEPPITPAPSVTAPPFQDPPPPVPDAAPEPIEESAPPPDTPSVLTQLGQSDAGVAQPAGDGLTSAAPATDTVTSAQIANVLRQANCLKLKRQDDEACPKPDPFAVAAAIAERAIPPERLFEDPRYVAKTVGDIVHEQEWAKLFHTPDADLFADPEAPGAYNARRIRNGQEPLWSEEMKAGFRKKD